MSAIPAESEDYETLKKKFNLIQGEHKSNVERSRTEITSTKQMVEEFKAENLNLRSELQKLQSNARPATTSTQSSTGGTISLERLEKQIVKARKELDDLKHSSRRKEGTLRELSDELTDLQREAVRPSAEDTPLTRHIRTLENRLDKAMIKYNEAMSIKKTYEQIVKRLKDERIGFDNQLAAMENTLRTKDKDLEELRQMSLDARNARDAAKTELESFEAALQEERALRQKELEERKKMLQQRKEMNKRTLQLENQRVQMKKKLEGDMSQEEEDALRKKNVVLKMMSKHSTSAMEDDTTKLQSYEDAFRRIKEATGVTDVNEVIHKFLSQEETKSNLMTMTKEAQAKIERLSQEAKELQGQVQELKYSGNAQNNRREVDKREQGIAEATQAMERNKQRYERIARILINVKAGAEHLSELLRPVHIDNETMVDVSDETVGTIVEQCLAKVKLLDEAHAAPGSQLASSQRPRSLQISPLPSSVPTLKAEDENSGDEDEDDIFDDDDSLEVLDRNAVKKSASDIVDRANKLSKKKKGKKV